MIHFIQKNRGLMIFLICLIASFYLISHYGFGVFIYTIITAPILFYRAALENITLASFGFSALFLIIYACSFLRVIAKEKLNPILKNHAFAYLSIASAFLFWAIAVWNNKFLAESIIVGNLLLFLATIFFINLLLANHAKLRDYALIASIIFTIFFIYLRINYFYPTPHINDGILIFNTHPIISVILVTTFSLIWFPASATTSAFLTKETSSKTFYTSLYTISTLSSIMLIASHSVDTIRASFIVLGSCFAAMLYSIKLIGDKNLALEDLSLPKGTKKVKYEVHNWASIAYIAIIFIFVMTSSNIKNDPLILTHLIMLCAFIMLSFVIPVNFSRRIRNLSKQEKTPLSLLLIASIGAILITIFSAILALIGVLSVVGF